MAESRLEIFAACQERVRGPGKFQGEDPCVAHFYDCALDGGGETIYDAEDPETPVDLFIVDDEDRATFAELAEVHAVLIWTTNDGFVCSRYLETEAELDALRAANDAAWEAQDNGDDADDSAEL